MFVAAIAHGHIFSYEEWQPNYIPLHMTASVADTLALHDFVRDFRSVLPKRRRKPPPPDAKPASARLDSPSDDLEEDGQHADNPLRDLDSAIRRGANARELLGDEDEDEDEERQRTPERSPDPLLGDGKLL